MITAIAAQAKCQLKPECMPIACDLRVPEGVAMQTHHEAEQHDVLVSQGNQGEQKLLLMIDPN